MNKKKIAIEIALVIGVVAGLVAIIYEGTMNEVIRPYFNAAAYFMLGTTILIGLGMYLTKSYFSPTAWKILALSIIITIILFFALPSPIELESITNVKEVIK